MKKILSCLAAGVMLALGAVSFAACGTSTITKTPNQGVSASVSERVVSYDDTAFYELENPGDVTFAFDTDKVQKISYMYRTLSSKDWSLKDGKITIKKSVFEGETSGEKRIRVFVDGSYVQVALRVVTKVIYTVSDFNSIRSNMNGVYVLGGDIDFAGEEFWPIGKSTTPDASGNYGVSSFEGIFDGRGYAVKNVDIRHSDHKEGEDGNGNGPSLGANALYGAGIFMTTSANAQILNTRFLNIYVEGQGLIGPVAGTNGGLIKNCFVTSTLKYNIAGWGAERAGAIAGQNAGGDSAGKIENCIAIYECSQGGARGIADWNTGTIKNCYAATVDSYVFHPAYDSATKSIPEDFDYDEFFNGLSAEDVFKYGFDNFTLPALPGTHGWNDYGTVTSGGRSFFKGGDIINTEIVRRDFLLDPANFSEENGWDRSVWEFTYGAFPTLKLLDR